MDQKQQKNEQTTTTLSSSTDVITTTSLDSNSEDLIIKLNRFPHLIKKIFSYLKPKDLRTIPCVCKAWSKILHSTPKAERRRLNSVKKLRKLKKIKGQENWPIDIKCAKFKRKLSKDRKRKALDSIQNLSKENFDINNNIDDDDKINQDQCSSFQDENNQNLQNYQQINPPNKKQKRWTLAEAPFKTW